jgi:hypothetical protein
VTPEKYCAAIDALDLTQEQAGRLFGVTGRTGQRWAADGPPIAVVMVLKIVGKDRAALDRLRKRCNIS